jgi:HEAT repeat protein
MDRDLRQRSLKLLLSATDSPFDDVAAHAMEALVDSAPQEGLPAFRDAVRSDRPLVRFAGLVSLGRIRDREARALITQQINDREPHVRLAAAFAALRIGGSEGRYGPILARALSDHPDENLRSEAAHLIGMLGEKRAKQRLRLVTQRDRSKKVVVHAYGALAMLGDPQGLNQLMAYTAGDQVSRVLALQLLLEIGDKRAMAAFYDRLYVNAESDEFLVVRLIAARGLGKLNDPRGFDGALHVMQTAGSIVAAIDSSDERENERVKLRQNAALALGAIGDPTAIPILAEAAEKDVPPVQVAAAYAILQILGKP